VGLLHEVRVAGPVVVVERRGAAVAVLLLDLLAHVGGGGQDALAGLGAQRGGRALVHRQLAQPPPAEAAPGAADHLVDRSLGQRHRGLDLASASLSWNVRHISTAAMKRAPTSLLSGSSSHNACAPPPTTLARMCFGFASRNFHPARGLRAALGEPASNFR
jgi:hypothetical protein